MKTLVVSLCLSLGLSQPLQAFENDALLTFANCAGRLSAVMEYQWMFDGIASEETERQRAAVLDLISAIIEPEQGREILHWQLAAKQAQSVLLTRATFNTDAEDAAWARQQADRHYEACTSLLLS